LNTTNLVSPYTLLLVGVATGIYSGIMGLGGGTIMIPIMVLLLGFNQHQATATSLAAMIPPVALPAVIYFYREGHVEIRTAVWIAVGIAAGSLLGAMVASSVPERALRLIFGFVLVYVGGYTVFMTLGKEYLARSMVLAGLLLAVAVVFFFVESMLTRRS